MCYSAYTVPWWPLDFSYFRLVLAVESLLLKHVGSYYYTSSLRMVKVELLIFCPFSLHEEESFFLWLPASECIFLKMYCDKVPRQNFFYIVFIVYVRGLLLYFCSGFMYRTRDGVKVRQAVISILVLDYVLLLPLRDSMLNVIQVQTLWHRHKIC